MKKSCTIINITKREAARFLPHVLAYREVLVSEELDGSARQVVGRNGDRYLLAIRTYLNTDKYELLVSRAVYDQVFYIPTKNEWLYEFLTNKQRYKMLSHMAKNIFDNFVMFKYNARSVFLKTTGLIGEEDFNTTDRYLEIGSYLGCAEEVSALMELEAKVNSILDWNKLQLPYAKKISLLPNNFRSKRITAIILDRYPTVYDPTTLSMYATAYALKSEADTRRIDEQLNLLKGTTEE